MLSSIALCGPISLYYKFNLQTSYIENATIELCLFFERLTLSSFKLWVQKHSFKFKPSAKRMRIDWLPKYNLYEKIMVL